MTWSQQPLDLVLYETADIILERRNQLLHITTGSKYLDKLLGGNGIETGSIIELFGASRTGKTQLAHQLCVTVQLPQSMGGLHEDGGEPVKAVYIDCEGTFRPERIVQMSMKYSNALNPLEVLQNIQVARAYNSDHQLSLIEKTLHGLDQEYTRLVVVDTLTSHVRAEYAIREGIERQNKLKKLLQPLRKMADAGLAVIETNQVAANIYSEEKETLIPVGGHVLGHASHTRVYLRKGKGNRRIARVIDSPLLPEREEIFFIVESGIE
ncbi:MAG: DNA repair and recombination protein RadA [Candidatus Odinarchaeota archaeon]